jgi:hypothetical protein
VLCCLCCDVAICTSSAEYGSKPWVNPVLSKALEIKASSPSSRFTDPKVSLAWRCLTGCVLCCECYLLPCNKQRVCPCYHPALNTCCCSSLAPLACMFWVLHGCMLECVLPSTPVAGAGIWSVHQHVLCWSSLRAPTTSCSRARSSSWAAQYAQHLVAAGPRPAAQAGVQLLCPAA